MILIVIALSWMVGAAIVLASPSRPNFEMVSVLVLAGLAGFGAWLSWDLRPARLIGLALLIIVLSGSRTQLELGRTEALLVPDASEAVEGVVAQSPRTVGRASVFVLDVRRVLQGGTWSDALGRIEVRSFGIHPGEGDLIQAFGQPRRLVDLPGLPRATMLRRQRVGQEMVADRVRVFSSEWTPALAIPGRVRSALEDVLYARLPEPHGSLVAGLLLGSRTAMPAELRAQLATTGTSHIVAVSGFNVSIVAGLLCALGTFLFGRRWGILAALVGLAAYTALVGASPSALRAALMVGVALLAGLVGRPTDGLASLALAGALMVALDPLVILDLGFQLSMLATAGLVLVLPQQAGQSGWRARIAHFLTPTVVAQAITLPIVLYTFHRLSLVAPLANVLIVPAVPAAMAAGGLVLLLDPFPPVAAPAAWLCAALAGWIIAVVEWSAGLPGAALATGAFPMSLVLACYFSVLVWLLLRSPEAERLRVRYAPIHRLPIAVAVALVLGLGAGTALAFQPTGRLEASFLEPGGSLFIRSPTGRTALIGASTNPTVLVASVAERLAPWERGLDVLMLVDGDAAELRAASALSAQYSIGLLLHGPSAQGQGAVPAAGSAVEASPGIAVDFGDGVRIDVLAVARAQAERLGPLAVEVTYGRTGIVLPLSDASSAPVENGDLSLVWVVRDQASARLVPPNTLAVVWDPAVLRLVSIVDGIDQAVSPSRDGPIGVSSNGEELVVSRRGRPM